jgi:5-(carboxyamino)imidazole ribonucleotide mutase
MSVAQKVLDELGVSNDMKVLSAHRTPEALIKYLKESQKNGTQVFIAGAGMAAHLAGTVAAHTTKPVIGVPLEGSHLKGLDALLSTVQMPGGIPVATVAIGKAGAKNAGLLAAQILAIKDSNLTKKIIALRKGEALALLLKDRQRIRKG